MKTKLEIMVGYLAGHQGEDVESIRREFEDPSSEASRWLEVVRARSRGIFGPGSSEGPDIVATRPGRLPEEPGRIAPRPGCDRPRAAATRVSGRRPARILWGASAAAVVLLAVGMAWRVRDDRLRRLETILDRREIRWGDRFQHLEEALTKKHEAPPPERPPTPKEPSPREVKPPTLLDGPTRLALNRIERKLGELEQRLGEGRTSQDLADQRVDDLRRDLDQLKLEVQTSSRAVREVLLLVRRLATRTQEPPPMQVPVPPQGTDPGFGRGPGILFGPGPIPKQGQMPGLEHNGGPNPTFRPPRAK